MDEITGRHLFDTELQKGEKILWIGQPSAALFPTSDTQMILYGWLTIGFIIVGVIISGASGFLSQNAPSIAGLPAHSTVYIILGPLILYLASRLISRFWIRKHTFYAVTDQRVLSACSISKKHFQFKYIKSMTSFKKATLASGKGTLYFGAGDAIDMTEKGKQARVVEIAFYDINHADEVADLINRQMQ